MIWITATNTDTQKQVADEKEFAEIAEKTTTQATKQMKTQINLSVQTLEKHNWHEVTPVKLK